MKKVIKSSYRNFKEFILSSKEIVWIFLCLTIFFISLLFFMGRVNTNTELGNKLKPYKEYLQVEIARDTEEIVIGPSYDKPLIKPFEKMYFHSVPSLLVWIFIISVFITFSVGLVPAYIAKIIHTRKEAKISGVYRLGIIISVLVIGAVTYFLEHSNTSFLKYPVEYKTAAELMKEFNILLHCPQKTVKLAVGIMFTAAFVGMAGLLILNKAIDNVKAAKIKEKADIHKIIARFTKLRADLKFYLYTLSFLVVGSILTTGMLRESILSILPRANDFMFPIEFVYLYGLSFSMLLIIAYVPIFVHLKSKSQKIITALDGIPAIGDTEELTTLKEKLLVQTTLFDNIKIVISLLAPLITSFLPNFM